MSKKLGFLVNAEKCIGCHSCEMACKNEYQLNPHIRWRRVYPLKEEDYSMPERNFLSLTCNNCAQPECLRVCPVGAYTKREDGIVHHNHARCIGCRLCAMACPYQIPQFNQQHKKVEKCNMCFQKIDRDENPACVDGCPLEAITVIDLNSFDELGTVKAFKGFPDPKITHPSVRFIKPKIAFQVRRDR